ncbi:ABC transporter ATP-binding protein [Entomobacter blattae]|uniref:Vitamin B12 import ATP-binding protein BtuD n=1 Tax=Entomobacter blattae TaxID=2762277 RepID=A0A7H1NT71_9PROT|nr:ABC transporter ATP-binding protein [Entomobacter blattae]QNT78981.1 Vitamin B12 import ATP-binding protein BtuD [Entomobacter blattae]
MAFIHIKNLDIFFPIYHGDSQTLKKQTANTLFKLSGKIVRDEHDHYTVRALHNITFSITSGERIGLVGSNGAGKTTLLRAMGGIFEPVRGCIEIDGSVSTLLDTNLGMNHELTGRENIQLRCLYNGYEQTKTKEIEQNVEEFSELGPFIDMPIKAYSSGMTLRLAFGLATAINPTILLMDEWFMAGDASFMEKARLRINTMVEKADIVVISTHQPDIIRRWCSRVIWLENGEVKMDAPPDTVLNVYLPSVE